MRWPDFYWAVYGIIRNDNWDILALKRWNTWRKDWWYWLPAWHIEWKESFFQALKREIKEEINVDLSEQDAKLVHISHRHSLPHRKYIDVYFEINNYRWIPKNNEPDKHSEMKYIEYESEEKFMPYLKEIFEKTKKWIPFSEDI